MEYIFSIVEPLQIFFTEVILFIPKLIAAYIIWLIGSWVIDKFMHFIDAIDVKRFKFDDHIRLVAKGVLKPVAKFLLILVILDTFGIGSNIISALANGLTATIAIALGLSFGKALEDDATTVVKSLKKKASK